MFTLFLLLQVLCHYPLYCVYDRLRLRLHLYVHRVSFLFDTEHCGTQGLWDEVDGEGVGRHLWFIRRAKEARAKARACCRLCAQHNDTDQISGCWHHSKASLAHLSHSEAGAVHCDVALGQHVLHPPTRVLQLERDFAVVGRLLDAGDAGRGVDVA